MTIPSLSDKLKKSLIDTLQTLKEKNTEQDTDTDSYTLLAMKQIHTRIQLGEEGLYDPLHTGDHLALKLAEIE